jgi:alkyl hydroperoxide reductase subunit AhpC
VSQLRDAYGEFRRLGVEVATVSVDSPYAHRVWAEELGVEFPMISDFEHELVGKYDAAASPPPAFLAGIMRYHTFVVDAGGTLRFVRYHDKEVSPATVEEILEVVRAFLGGDSAVIHTP